MAEESSSRVTALLQQWCDGDDAARDRVFAEVYADLRRFALRGLAGERFASLTPTALVHEAYLRLVGLKEMEWQGRTHFLAAGAGAMRRILVDRARARRAVKRDGGIRVTLSDSAAPAPGAEVDVLAVHEALEALAQKNARHAQIVELRFFGGLTVPEVASYLGIAPVTVKRDWQVARAWLFRALQDSGPVQE